MTWEEVLILIKPPRCISLHSSRDIAKNSCAIKPTKNENLFHKSNRLHLHFLSVYWLNNPSISISIRTLSMNQLLNTWNWIMYLEYSKITTFEFFYRRLWYHKKVVKWVTYETVKCKFIWLSHLRVAWKWLVSFGKTHANI